MSKSSLFLRLGVVLSLALAVGCARPRHGEQFEPRLTTGTRTQTPMASDPMSGADQPGALYDNARVDLVPAKEIAAKSPGQIARQPVEGLSKTVQENVTAPGPDDPAATRPNGSNGALSTSTTQANQATQATRPAQGAAIGEFFTIGGVVAVVDGNPIFANKVLNLAEPILAARAKELDTARFRSLAEKELTETRNALVNLELEYAAAEKNLDQRDKDIAWNLTMIWKLRQITEASGSEELARKNTAEIARRNRPPLNPNATFDELVSEIYRVHMSQVFYQKKIMPRIQVSAAEMREYYDRNLQQLFTVRGAAQFRLIKIDVRKAGGREQAMDKITGIRNRIVRAGQPFESLASSVNDNPLLLKTGGMVKIDQGAFAVKQVDDAVWSTPEGEVTEIIDGGDALYIAQVLERKPQHVQPFEDEAAQVRIKDDLFSRDFKEMRRKELTQLEREAVIRSDPSMMNTVLEMAMQNYRRWAGK